MSSARLSVLVASVALFGTLGTAGEGRLKTGTGGGAGKLRLVSVAESPDPWSPGVAPALDIEAELDARPTDAGAGNDKNGKTFVLRVTVEISDAGGTVVRTLSGEFPVEFPEKMPASDCHRVTCALEWDGLAGSGGSVPDGTYSYAVQGTLVRYDELGNGKTQEHVVGTSGVLSGSVVLDSQPPELARLSPAETYTNDPRIEISGKAVDAGSGIASVVMTVDGAARGSYDPATGVVSFKPTEDLPEKWLTIVISAADAAGNTASITWKFCEDRTPPAASGAAPEADSWVKSLRPDIGLTVMDALAGVEPATVSVKVLGETVEHSFDPGTGRVSYAPQADLPEG